VPFSTAFGLFGGALDDLAAQPDDLAVKPVGWAAPPDDLAVKPDDWALQPDDLAF